jgi:GTP pyrophosphokinase
MSSGKGLVIHRQDCKNVRHYQNQPDKWLDVEWSPASEQLFSVDMQIEAKNQRGTLAMVASEIANTKTDIQRVRSEDKDETYSVMHFVLSVRNREHLDDLLRHLRRIPLIEKAFRVDSH